MKKAFVFDLDGTLLTSEKQITPRVIKNLHYLNRSSHEIIFASARPPRFVEPVSKIFPFKTHVISYNGAMYKTDKGQLVSFSIPKDLVRDIIEFLYEYDPECIISSELDDSWITSMEFNFKEFFVEEDSPKLVSRDELMDNHCTKILLNKCTQSELLIKRFSDRCNIIITDNGTLIQIMSLTASKENAVKHLMESMGLTLENVTCFGDDHNDIGLFKSCGTSVAMGNSIPELKELATHITETNDNEGISRYIEGNL